jgi:aminobenzoyl-glutamate transport protein
MSDTEVRARPSGMQRMLAGIERVGNKVPHPAIIFLALCLIVIVLSHLLYLANVAVTYEVATPPPIEVEQDYLGGSGNPYEEVPAPEGTVPDYEIETETTAIESLLTADGIRFLVTSAVQNINNFGVIAVILVAMIGVGVAEEAGLIAALIRSMVRVAPPRAMTFIIVFIGMLSSVATDAGYLVLIPLGAAAFVTLGRHPLAGIAAAYAGVSAGFAVNILIAPVDGILTEITNESISLVDPGATVDVTANLFFAIASTLFVTAVITIVSERFVEPSLGRFDPADRPEGGHAEPELTAEQAVAEKKGLRYSTISTVAAAVVVAALTVPPGAPLRNAETGEVFGDSPFMSGLILIISLLFLAAGLGFGRGSGKLSGSVPVINAITKTFSGLGGLIFLLVIVAQFIAYFNYTNMPTVAAVSLAEVLESASIAAVWLLLGFILVVTILNLIMPGVIPKWAILAPIFIPLFMQLDIAPQTVLAAYRVGDGPSNVITPLMVYLPFIVLLMQRYRKDAGVGTVVSLMLPFTAVLAVLWTIFFVVWFLIGIPLGPGAPVGVT